MNLANRGGWLGFLPLSSFLCKNFDNRVSPASRVDESIFLQKEWRDL